MAEPPIYINPLVTGGGEDKPPFQGGDAALPTDPHDHKALRNIGARSHAEIDELLAAAADHAADEGIHFARASLTHAELQGVGETKSHAEIDKDLAAAAAHAADEGIHFARASLTHAELQGVGGTKSHAEIDEELAAAAAHAADEGIHFPAASIQLSAAPGGESLVASTGPRTIKAMIAGPGIKMTSDPDTLTIAADGEGAAARIAALEARTQNAGATPGVTTFTGAVSVARPLALPPAGLVAAVASDPPPQARSGGYASANGWTFTTAKQITIAAVGMAACHYIGGGTRQFRFWRQPPPTNAEPAPGVKLFDVTFDPTRAQPEGAFLRQMLETPVALPPGDYVIMVDTNGQDMGDNRIVNTVAPDLTKVFGAFNQTPGGYPYQIENRHAQPTIGTFWYALGALAPAVPSPAALSVAGPIRSPLLELKASTALTPQDMCGVIVVTPSGPTTITLPKTADYQAGYNQTVIFARNMAAGADFPVTLVAPAPGWEGRGVRALALNGVNPTYTVQANAAVYIHSGSMKVSAAYLLINPSSTTIPIPITAATYTTMTPIAFSDVSNPFAEFFTANDAKTTLTVKVGGSYQIGYQCCIDSKGGKAYQVCVALMVAPPGSAASTIIPGTQTAAGNYQDEDIAINFFHPFITVAAGSVITLAVCHNGTLEGGVRSAGLSIKGEF